MKYRGKRPGRLRSKTNAGVHWKNLKKITLDHTFIINAHRQKKLCLSTVNIRSVRGKSADLLQHILEQGIDLCVIAETWLQSDGDDISMGELSQDGYCFHDVPRPDSKGEGIALLYKDNLKVSKCPDRSFQSFEYAEWKICNQRLVFYIIGIYRPPYYEGHPVTQAMFIKEFTDCLEQVVMRSESFGDAR